MQDWPLLNTIQCTETRRCEDDVETIKSIVSCEDGLKHQLDSLYQFKEEVAKKKTIKDIMLKIDRSKYIDVHIKRSKPDPIIRVRCTKPKKDKKLAMLLIRKSHDQSYTEVIFVRELLKYGYNEWIKILDIIKNHKGIHAQELKLTLDILINKVKGLDLVLAEKHKTPSTSASTSRSRKSTNVDFLLPFGTKYINNSLLVGVDFV